MLGRYRIRAKLGQGGLATVWKAQDELLGRTVALKILNEQLASSSKARRRFLHDAQATAALDHPGIIAVYDTGEAEGLAYIALSLIDGQTVSERAAARLLPVEEAVRIVRDAAQALGHAHERGVLHRDVTGRNIMVARDGRVFVLDFGLALAAGESRVTTTGTALGTILYMAPEVIQAREADVRSDVYGLGVVLYEALTGTFPFVADAPQAVFYSATNLDAVAPRARRPDIPVALERVVLKAIAREPEERYQTAAEFAGALDALVLPAPGSPAGGARVEAAAAAPDSNGSERAEEAGHRGPIYLAVLPFEAVESPADPEHVCATLARRLVESVGGALAGATGVRVVATPETAPNSDPREVATRIGASVLLRGSVRREGSDVRVAYSLLDPMRGVQVGGGVLDGSAFHIFEMEDRVVTSVARALGVEPSGTRPTRPPDPAASERYLQALAYLRRHDNEASVDGAIGLLEQLAASDPQSAIVQAALSRAYLFKHLRTKQRIWEGRAAAACERAISLDADVPEVHLALGAMRLQSGQHQAALEAFTRVLRERPDDFEATLGLARAHAAAGRITPARTACERAMALRPTDWRGHHQMGRLHLQAGEFGRAIEPYRRAIELTPDNAISRLQFGTALYRLDRFDEAAAAFRESLAIQPNDEAYQNLGTVLYFMGRYDEAIPAFRKATELVPSSPTRWGNLGNACRWLPGHEAETEAALERAIGLMREQLERDPSRAESWALLAGWLMNRDRRDEAEAAIGRALSLAPGDVHCMVRAGHVYHLLGDRSRALHWFREARRAGFGPEELRRSPDLGSLLTDPEFIRILEDKPAPTTPGPDVPGGGSSARMDAA